MKIQWLFQRNFRNFSCPGKNTIVEFVVHVLPSIPKVELQLQKCMRYPGTLLKNVVREFHFQMWPTISHSRTLWNFFSNESFFFEMYWNLKLTIHEALLQLTTFIAHKFSPQIPTQKLTPKALTNLQPFFSKSIKRYSQYAEWKISPGMWKRDNEL